MIRNLDANYLSTFHAAPTSVGACPALLPGVLRILLGIGGGLRVTTDDDA